MKPVLAIDPGLTGAMAAYDGDILLIKDVAIYVDRKRTRLDLPRLVSDMRQLAFHVKAFDVLIEHVGSMPRQGVSSAFNFGFTVGALNATAITLALDLHTVIPTQWKFGVGINANRDDNKRARKNASRAKAIELFPQHAELFARVKDDGRAEAALMAWWFVHKRTAVFNAIKEQAK